MNEVWGWPAESVARVVHEGENVTWRVEAPEGPRAVRLYRPGRRTLGEIEAEWAWVEALADEVPTARPLRTVGGALVATVESPAGPRWAVAMEWVEGAHPDPRDPAHAFELGRLIGGLRRAVRRVEAAVMADWPGHDRPRTTPESIVTATLGALSDASFVGAEQHARLGRGVDRLVRRLAGCPLGAPAFVHADLHVGNVLVTASGWRCLDFDDSVFGPPLLDLATPRVHQRAVGGFDALWAAMAAGYGEPIDDEAIRLTTALQLVQTLGEFPSHLDIPALGRDPGAVVERYLGYLGAELGPL